MSLQEKILGAHRTFYVILFMAILFLGLTLGTTLSYGAVMFQKGTLTQDQILIILTELLGTSISVLLVVVTIFEGRRYRSESIKDRIIDHMRKKIEFYSLIKGKSDILHAEDLDNSIFISNFESFLNTNNIEQKYVQWASSELQTAIVVYFAFFYHKERDEKDKIDQITQIANIVDNEYKTMITRYLSFHSLE